MICSYNQDKTIFKVTCPNNIFTKFFNNKGKILLVTPELEESTFYSDPNDSLPKEVTGAISKFEVEVKEAMGWLESARDIDLYLYILRNKHKLSEEEKLLLIEQC